MSSQDDMSPSQNQVMALAGLIQCTNQVHMIARQGKWNNPVASTCIHSLFQLEPDSVVDVYSEIHALRPGLQHLKQLLMKSVDQADVEVTRYALTLMHIEQKLRKHSQIMDRIRAGLYAIKNEFDISRIDSHELLARIAAVYVDTVSTIPPKVKVEGSREYLMQEVNTHRVRTMLFAGIRSAVLWHQLGGTRWKLFFQRKRMLHNTELLMAL